jgi:phosphatidylserine decarboxylase
MDLSKLEKTRINNRLPVAREGIPFIVVGSLITLFLFYMGLLILPVLTGLLSLFTIYFFRDPERGTEVRDNAVLAPADGRIIDIRDLMGENNIYGAPAVKVSIFMSVFSVHVNRIPVSGRISRITYHPGKFFSANLDKASTENENNRITLETRDGRMLMTVQIAGLIARRIACWVREGNQVTAGKRFGLIRFGSRLDVYLPDNSQIIARVHQKVRAGETVLGYLS